MRRRCQACGGMFVSEGAMPFCWRCAAERESEEMESESEIAERADAAYQEWKRDPSTARPYEEFRAELIAEGLLDDNGGSYGRGKQMKRMAYNRVARALKIGKLIKSEVCQVCDSTPEQRAMDWQECADRFGFPLFPRARGFTTVAHHWRGYEHPLDVWWVCPSCNGLLAHRHDGSLTIEAARLLKRRRLDLFKEWWDNRRAEVQP